MAAKKNGKTVQLTNEFLQKVSKPGIYTDGPGRYGLDCKVSLSNKCADPNRYFRQKTTFLKKRITVGIGAYPGLSLQDARDISHDNWKKARAGIDPRKVKQWCEDKKHRADTPVTDRVRRQLSKPQSTEGGV